MYPIDFLQEKLPVTWFASWEEYRQWKISTDCSYQRAIENKIVQSYSLSGFPFTFLKGECVFCQMPSNFLLDEVSGYGYRSDSDFNPNWRERLICSRCNLNNRARMVYSILEVFPSNIETWITEQDTSFFRALSGRFTNLVGSEFLGHDWVSGRYNEKGLKHENITSTSFNDSSLSCVITLDVLEYVEKTDDALSEIFRILKPGGTLLATFPFDQESPINFERAQKNEDGSYTYFAPPEFHDNPAQDEPILCFRHFGWQILRDLEECGFAEAKIGLVWSQELMNLGSDQIFLIAKK